MGGKILDFSVNPNNDGITISYKTDKLVTAMAEVTILQNDPMTLNFPLYATGGKDMLEEVRIRCVAATAKLYVTDMAGQTNTSDSIPVPVNTGDCQDDN